MLYNVVYNVQATLEICGAENRSCRLQLDSFFSFLLCVYSIFTFRKSAGRRLKSFPHEIIIKEPCMNDDGP